MPDIDGPEILNLLEDLIAKAKRAGAHTADAVAIAGTSLSHTRRLGKTEKLERSETQDLGLRVLIGKQQAMVSSSDRAPAAIDQLVERAVAMARAIPEDPFCGLADPDQITHDWPTLDIFDPDEPNAETLIERARAAEEAALAVQRDGVERDVVVEVVVVRLVRPGDVVRALRRARVRVHVH